MTTNGGQGWTVTSQQEKPGQAANGLFTTGWEITFQTTSGQTGTVFVPNAQYTVENVKAAINAKVATMGMISGLSG